MQESDYQTNDNTTNTNQTNTNQKGAGAKGPGAKGAGAKWSRILTILALLVLLAVVFLYAYKFYKQQTDYRPGVRSGKIWQPRPGTTFHWQLTGRIDTSLDVDMYDIDLFDTHETTIQALQADGKVVICYFSAGSFEPWRSDAHLFPRELLANKMQHWNEWWLDIRYLDELKAIMTSRMDLAVKKGCDGVEPDNVDAYSNNTGRPLTPEDQLSYNIMLATEAHKRGLSIGLKNNLEQVRELEPYFDWALNEECISYRECEMLLPFVEAGKAVFGAIYEHHADDFCDYTNSLGYSFWQKTYSLDASGRSCTNYW